MVIDTSALLAILQDEPERQSFNQAVESAETRSLPAASFLELSMIIESRCGPESIRDLDLFLGRAKVDLVPVDTEQAYLARQAFRKYGEGRHPEALNFGDCFAYALAKNLAVPLLFKGDDFSHTRIWPLQPHNRRN